MTQPNRKQRREAARRPRAVPMVRMGLLTIPEAELMAEWADAYLRLQDEELPDERTVAMDWATDRTLQLREMLQAAVEGRPQHDGHAERLEPQP